MSDTDEIARLRALWCEEKSKSMTFYAEVERLRAELAQRLVVRDALAAENSALKAEVAALKAKADPLAEMWRELEEYQPMADANGHGDTWRAMCHKRTEEAASAAYLARQWSSHVAAAAYGAWWAAQRDAAVRRISNDAVKWAADAVAAIRRAKEVQR
jgi:hypothetical protein